MKNYLFKKFAALTALVAMCCCAAHAIEITLAENKSKTGLVGFVDLEAVFNANEQTKQAKSEFDSELKVKEKEILDRRAEIYSLKGQLQKLSQERAYLVSLNPQSAKTPASGATNKLADNNSEVIKQSEVIISSINALINPSVVVSSPSAAAAPVMVNANTDTVKTSTKTVSQSPVVTIAELNATILTLERGIASKETELKQYLTIAERELTDYENRRMRVILGRIYYVLRELAAQEGISVVVDKRSILYGEKAVDLTPKLLEKMSQMQY